MLIKYLKIFLIGTLFLALFAVSLATQKLAAKAQAADNNFTITWSSNSYVPLGYEGLALPTRSSQIKVFVLPVKKLNVDPEKLTYRWLLDEEIINGAGGQGKSVFSFKATRWADDYHTVQSQVLSGEDIVWRGFVEIKISGAEIIFRLPNSDYAIAETFSAKTGQTLKIFAVPFFFNTKNFSNLNFQWKLDSQELTSSDNKDLNIFSLTMPAGQLEKTLIKKINLTISNKQNNDQQASSQITLEIK